MELVGMRVRYFRTVGQTDIDLPLDQFLTIVGPNNSGKTNLLRAVQMFFTGHDNSFNYLRERDFTFNGGNGKTSLHATFRVDPSSPLDVQVIAEIDKLYGLYEIERKTDLVSLSLVFSPSGSPVYQFLPNTKKPGDGATQTQISRLQRQLVSDILDQFACHYVPSEKSVKQLYDEVLNPFLRAVAADAVRPQIEELTAALDNVANRINGEIGAAGLGGISASFGVPRQALPELFNSFEFRLSDPVDTEFSQKGQGIQSTAFFAALRWVSEAEEQRGKRVVWLLEEPESYLHPELMAMVYGILRRVAEVSTVVVTTHSLSFVPDDPRQILGTSMSGGVTQAERFDTYAGATESIRRGLGVRFSDFFNLRPYNVAVEGKSDRELMSWYLDVASPEEVPLHRLRAAHVLDFGGVKGLSGWLRATFPYVRKERCLVSVFDGDQAGERERRDLNQFFGQKNIPWQANRDYVMVRKDFPVEALFPDEWISDAFDQHPGWFDDFAVDSSGVLTSFQLKDGKKTEFQQAMVGRAEGEAGSAWRSRWDSFAGSIDGALGSQEARVG